MRTSCEVALPLLYHLIREMVDHPEDVLIRQTDAGRRMVFEVYAHRDDVRKVIGTRGRHVDAVRTILTGIAAKADRTVLVDLIEPHVKRPDELPLPMDHILTSIEKPERRIAEMLLRLVRALVTRPDDAAVQVTSGAQVAILTLELADCDISRVIGRKGRTITALRDLVHALCGRHGRTCLVDIVEPSSSPPSRLRPLSGRRRP